MIDKELWNTLYTMNPDEVSRRSLADYNPKTHSYNLDVFNYACVVHPENRTLQYGKPNPPSSSGFHLALSIVNYLIGAKDVPQIGQWVSEKEFPSGPIFFRGNHEMPSRKIVSVFGDNRDDFSSTSLSLGAKKVEGADIAFEFNVFPRLPVRLLLWLADDEFSARLGFLFDKTANLHFKLDGLWAVGKLIESVLTALAPQTPEPNKSF
jgi:hypothetical protein